MKAKTSGNFKPVPLPEPQTTVARCYSLIDIGTVPNMYQGTLQGMVHKIFLTWELPKLKAVFSDEKGEEPFVISEEFTLSTKENSNFYKLIGNWRGKPLDAKEQESFDPAIMLGKTAVIQFIHKRKKKFSGTDIKEVTTENTNMKMQGIMKRSPDMEMPAAVNPVIIWDWEAIESGESPFDKEVWEKIPNFLRNKIQESEEYKKFAPKDSGTPGGESKAKEDGSTEPVSTDEW